MAQGVLLFKYEEAKKETGMTTWGGYMDFATIMGLGESIERHLQIKQRGW